MAIIYASLINQYKFKYHTVFSAKFDKQNEDNRILDETALFNNLNINHNLTATDIDNINIISPLENQIQMQEMKDSGWRFDKFISMKISFFKTDELNGLSYVKIPLRANAILNSENIDKFCFIWSLLAYPHPCENRHLTIVKNNKQYFNELNTQGFDFTNGFRCGDVHKFEKLNNLSINIDELSFYQDQDRWKHNSIPIAFSKNESARIVDLLIYTNHYALLKNLHVFSGNHIKIFYM